MKYIWIVVIQADPIFFPDAHTVQLFSQCLVIRIVKIQTADLVMAVFGVAVRCHNRTQPLPQNQLIQVADLMLYLVSELHTAFLLHARIIKSEPVTNIRKTFPFVNT